MKRFIPSKLGIVACCLSVVASFAFNTYQYWPGWIDGDGSAMLWEAHYGWFESYLPVVMTMMVRLILLVTLPSIAPILLFQLILAYVSLAWVFNWYGFSWQRTLICTSLLMLLPPVSAYAGTIVKDVWFAWAAILATATLGKMGTKRTPVWIVPWVIFSTLALSFRVDALSWLLAVALVYAAYQISLKRYSEFTWIMMSMPVIFGIYLGLPQLVEKAVPVEKRYATQQVLLFDLAALSLAEEKLLIPDRFNPKGHGMDFLQSKFNPTSNMPILDWGQRGQGFVLIHTAEAQSELKQAWIESIKRVPRAYLSHRWRIAKYYLFGVPDGVGWFWYRYRTSPNVFDESASVSSVRAFWQKHILSSLEGSVLNQLWPYLLISFASFGYSLWRRKSTVHFVILLAIGSAAYSLGFATVAPNVGFRYYTFQVIAATLSVFLSVASKSREPYRN